MANPDLSLFCVPSPELPDDCIPFPGGVTICAQAGYDEGSPLAVSKDLFGAVGAALAPLAPVLNVIDVSLALFKCVQAVPKCLEQLSPTPVLQCLPDLVEKANKLVQLIPQFALPATIKGIITALVSFLGGLKGKLSAIIRRQSQINAGRARATELGNTQLTIALDCAQGTLDAQVANLNKGMTPVNRLIGIVSAFMQIAGLGCIPPLGNIGDITGDVLSPIDFAIDLLKTIRDVIPDLPALSLPPGGDC